MLVLFPVHDRVGLLPYFLRYYTSIGATRFVCALFNGKANPVYAKIASFQTRYPLQICPSFVARVEKYNPFDEKRALNRLRLEFCEKAQWYCIADLDEFHYFEGKSMLDAVRKAKRHKFQAVGGVLVDRLAANGKFPPIRGSLDKTFPLGSDLTYCCGANNGKISLARYDVTIELGHHYTYVEIGWGISETHHFKWSRGVYRTLALRQKFYSKQGVPWAKTELPVQLSLTRRGVNLAMPNLRLRKADKLGV